MCRLGELVGGVRKRRRGALCGAGAVGQGIGALADRRKRRSRRLGATGDRIGRALELADHGAEFELQKLEDCLGRIAFGRNGFRRAGDRLDLGLGGR